MVKHRRWEVKIEKLSIEWACQKTAVSFCVFVAKNYLFLEKQTNKHVNSYILLNSSFLTVNTCQIILCVSKDLGTQPHCGYDARYVILLKH